MGNPAIRPEDGGSCMECRHFLGARSHPVHRVCVVCAKVGDFYGNAAAGCRYWERSDEDRRNPENRPAGSTSAT